MLSVDSDATASALLRGRFDNTEFLALTRFFNAIEATGRLRLSNNRWMAELYFDNGQLVAATAYEERGLRALEFIVLVLPRAEFAFWPGPICTDRSLAMSPDEIAEYVRSIARERPGVSAADLSTDSVVALIDLPTEAGLNLPVQFSPREFLLVARLDGRKTIAQLAREHGQAHALKALTLALQAGLVTAHSRIGYHPSDRRDYLLVGSYVAALAAGEILISNSSPVAGFGVDLVVLFALLLHSSFSSYPRRGLLLALAVAPLIRLISMAVVLTGAPPVLWYPLSGVPLFAAGVIALRTLGLSRADVRLRLSRIPTQLLIGLLGLPLGLMEFVLVRPSELVTEYTASWPTLVGFALILVLCVGVLEEFLFRGLLQAAAERWLGAGGLVFASVVFAVLHISDGSFISVGFAMCLALTFGWLVKRTGSLLGVSLAHSLTSISASLVLPLVSLTVR